MDTATFIWVGAAILVAAAFVVIVIAIARLTREASSFRQEVAQLGELRPTFADVQRGVDSLVGRARSTYEQLPRRPRQLRLPR